MQQFSIEPICGGVWKVNWGVTGVYIAYGISHDTYVAMNAALPITM